MAPVCRGLRCQVVDTVLGRCVVVLLFLILATSARAAPPSLSAEQQQRLEAGEVVLLDALPPGGSASAQGGTAVAFVCAPTVVVWDILVDWRNHTALYPRVTRAEVTQREPARVRVRYTLAIGPFSFDVHMDKHPDAARRRVEWSLAEDLPSSFFAESSGYWQVDAAGADSLVTHAVASRTLVPAFLTRGSQRESLVATVEALRKQAGKVSAHGPGADNPQSAPPCSKPAPRGQVRPREYARHPNASAP